MVNPQDFIDYQFATYAVYTETKGGDINGSWIPNDNYVSNGRWLLMELAGIYRAF